MDRVNWVTSEAFNAIRQLGGADSQTLDPALAHQRLRSFIEGLMRRGAEAGFGQDDAREMGYAVAALADEVAMTHAGALRDYWSSQPLQLTYFQENTAGENFFHRLDAIRSDARRVEVLRVYYLCLLLGFRGRYRVQGGELPLSDLIESVRVQLEAALPMPQLLSPEGERPEERLRTTVRRFPVVWIGLGAVVLSLLLYVGMQVSLAERSTDVVKRMQAQLTDEEVKP